MGDSWGSIDIETPDENIDRARQMIEYVEGQMEHGRRSGVDFSDVDTLIHGAKMMIEAGNFGDAMELVTQASEAAGERIMDFETLNRKLEVAEQEMEKALNNGKDTTEANKLLKLAKYHRTQGDYKIAIDYAKRVYDVLTAKKDVEIAWGSGL